MSEIRIKLATPTVPNYLMHADPPVGRRQDGIRETPKVDIADVPDAALEEIGREWTAALRQRAIERRHARQS